MNLAADAFRDVAWPASMLPRALAHVATTYGEGAHASKTVTSIVVQGEGAVLATSIEHAAAVLHIEAQPIACEPAELAELVAKCAPALIALPSSSTFLVVVRSARFGRVVIEAPDGNRAAVDVAAVVDALLAPLDTKHAADLDRLLAFAPTASRGRARRALLLELAASTGVEAGFLVRPRGTAPVARQLALTGAFRHAAVLFASLVAAGAVGVGVWIALARGLFAGRVDTGWLLAAALFAATWLALRLSSLRASAALSLRIATVLRRRLLAGALVLDADKLRHEGIGRLFGRVLEASSLEQLGTAAVATATACAELGIAFAVLSSVGPPPLLGLVAMLALSGLVVRRLWQRRERWVDGRLELTSDLVERMIGHRTRLAQQPPHQRCDGDDDALTRSLIDARAMDRLTTLLRSIPRAWLLLGLVALLPSIASHAAPVALAVGVGGVLMAAQGLHHLATSLSQVLASSSAAVRVRKLLADENTEPAPAALAATASEQSATNVAEARDVTYRYAPGARTVLDGVDLKIARGDRVLLEGPSGGGKSTLAAVLCGARVPESGLLLSGGFDRHTLGLAGIRARAARTPQFHENHVLAAPLLFNLLMGRRWPPTQDDVKDAIAVCKELGLDSVIDRMPGGLLQMIGDTGWQLSHGEKSRLFIARSLLQKAELVVIDEGFAALDPETLGRCLRAVLARAPTLLVIAHP